MALKQLTSSNHLAISVRSLSRFFNGLSVEPPGLNEVSGRIPVAKVSEFPLPVMTSKTARTISVATTNPPTNLLMVGPLPCARSSDRSSHHQVSGVVLRPRHHQQRELIAVIPISETVGSGAEPEKKTARLHGGGCEDCTL